jgi:nitrogenase molybdenum-iron protein beta chain
VGHVHFPTLGYRGGLYLLTRIVNTLLERADRDAPDEELELVL